MTDLNLDGESHAHSLIAAGKVDKESSWSFSANDGDKLLGAGGDDWEAYSKFHLGLDRSAAEKTKARYKYPFGKAGKVYRSGIIAAKQRAAQQNDSAIEKAAGMLLEMIDGADGDEGMMGDGGMMGANSLAFASINELRDAMKNGASSRPDNIRASFDTEVKAIDGTRSLTFTISTASVDRMGDTLAIDGWKLDTFRKNPVVLWAHDSSSLPPAKASQVRIEGDKLKANAEFVPADVPVIGPFAEAALQLYKHGFLNATSVGFWPLKYAFTDDPQRGFGIDFMEQELLEFSLVPVPANAEALIEGRKAGINVGVVLDWCELAIKRAGDRARVIKFAEGVLGSRGDDAELVDWAERIVCGSGKSIMHNARLQAIHALAEEFRSDAKKASGSKGASGIYRRCANRVEKAITGQEPAPLALTPAANIATGFAEIAARRLTTVRHRTTV